MTYYNPLRHATGHLCTPGEPRLEGAALPAGLNDIIRSVATTYDAVVVETGHHRERCSRRRNGLPTPHTPATTTLPTPSRKRSTCRRSSGRPAQPGGVAARPVQLSLDPRNGWGVILISHDHGLVVGRRVGVAGLPALPRDGVLGLVRRWGWVRQRLVGCARGWFHSCSHAGSQGQRLGSVGRVSRGSGEWAGHCDQLSAQGRAAERAWAPAVSGPEARMPAVWKQVVRDRGAQGPGGVGAEVSEAGGPGSVDQVGEYGFDDRVSAVDDVGSTVGRVELVKTGW